MPSAFCAKHLHKSDKVTSIQKMASISREQCLDASDVELLEKGDDACVIKREVFLDLGPRVSAEMRRVFADRPELFSQGGMGMSEQRGTNGKLRGDKRCWVTPSLCREQGLEATAELVRRMVRLCSSALKTPFALNGDYSVQAACFPGGSAHYVRHRDTFLDKNGLPTSENKANSFRKLTMIYYLNESFDGGQLRVFRADGHEDIDPALGTLVLFKSKYLEHEVLPCKQHRYAITLWASSSTSSHKSISTLLPRSTDHSWRNPLLSHDLGVLVGSPLEKMATERSIFVSIANYRDSEGPLTLMDMFAKAAHPDRIHVGYLLQADPIADKACLLDEDLLQQADREFPGTASWLRTNVHSLIVDPAQSTGPCWARSQAQTLYRGENYALQIDSHMRFRPNWDSFLIALLEHIRAGCLRDAKPILTTYPIGYELPNRVPKDCRPTVLLPWKFDEHNLLRQTAKAVNVSSTAPLHFLKSPLWAAGFNFSDGSVISEVPYSPFLPNLFFGEEISMAARLYTHGYDFYAPTTSVLYHLYSRTHRPTFRSLSLQENEKDAREGSLNVVRRMMQIGDVEEKENEKDDLLRQNKGGYWLGTVRSLLQFEREVGVSFHHVEVRTDLRWCDCLIPMFMSSSATLSFAEESLSTEVSSEDTAALIRSKIGANDGSASAEEILKRVNKYIFNT